MLNKPHNFAFPQKLFHEYHQSIKQTRATDLQVEAVCECYQQTTSVCSIGKLIQSRFKISKILKFIPSSSDEFTKKNKYKHLNKSFD